MGQSLLTIGVFFAVMVSLPWLIKWLRNKVADASVASTAAVRVVSAVAVGPQQRVVCIESGPSGDRVMLTLGVTAQHISVLHRARLKDGASASMLVEDSERRDNHEQSPA